MATKQKTSSTKSGFSDFEREAMKDRARELKQEKARKGGAKADAEPDVLAKIAEMAEADRELAGRFHALVRECAPDLTSRLWYGMPAYARDGKVVCHFQEATKFKTRYAEIGFSDQAHLDQGSMWPTAYALTTWNQTNEKQLRSLLKKAAG